jgi:hypothetical protein
VNRAAPALFELGGRRRVPSELAAAAALAVVWIVLWTVFTAGVVEGAIAFRDAARPSQASAEAAVTTAR